MVTVDKSVSWQAKRLEIAKTIANQMPLSELIEYSDWLKANLDLKPHYYRDVLIAAKAIEIKVGGV